MAILRNKEIKSVNIEELKTKLEELKKDLIKLNVQKSTGTSAKNPRQIKEIKRTIARILTLVHSRSLKKANQEGRQEPPKEEKTEKRGEITKNG